MEAGSQWRIAMVVEATGGRPGRHVLDPANALARVDQVVHVLYSSRHRDRAFGAGMDRRAGVRWAEVSSGREPRISDRAAIARCRTYLSAANRPQARANQRSDHGHLAHLPIQTRALRIQGKIRP